MLPMFALPSGQIMLPTGQLCCNRAICVDARCVDFPVRALRAAHKSDDGPIHWLPSHPGVDGVITTPDSLVDFHKR